MAGGRPQSDANLAGVLAVNLWNLSGSRVYSARPGAQIARRAQVVTASQEPYDPRLAQQAFEEAGMTRDQMVSISLPR